MTTRSTRVLITTASVLVLGLVSAWAYSSGSSVARDSIKPSGLILREGGDYTVPNGQVALITYLGADSSTITDVGISVDGEPILNANEAGDPDSTNVLVTVCGGSTIQVYGGLLEKQDALCRGTLVAHKRMKIICK